LQDRPAGRTEAGAVGGVAAILGDIHAPYEDARALSVALRIVEAVQPELLVVNGDLCDFYQLSRFDPCPTRKMKLQEDIDVAKGILLRLGLKAPSARKVLKKGNHEDRLDRWRRRNAEVGGLDCLKLENLLNLGSMGWELIDANQRLEWNGFTITHGDLCRKRGGATAQAMIDKFGTNGISNHVHRFAQVEKRDACRNYLWIENGCLCGLDPEYTEVADWQHGMTVLTFTDGVVWPELVRIRDGRARFRGLPFVA
jgi:hypothetical protein